MLTKEQYAFVDDAYEWFNKRLFDNKLPGLLITFSKSRPNTLGVYRPETMISRKGKKHIQEIELNPNAFPGRNDLAILSTLVHEMCHHWQYQFGRPAKGGYHNNEWADKMESVGLMPSASGMPGGKRTGVCMSHYMLPGAQFEKVAKEILNNRKEGLRFEPGARGLISAAAARSRASKTKYTCSVCGQNAWAKPGANLICGFCNLPMTARDE